LAKEKIKPEIEGIFGEIVDQPALRELLYESSDRGHTRTQPHDSKITVPKRSEDAIEERRGFDQEN
jgi:hypothetical protein